MLMSSDTINMRTYYSNTLTMWYESTLCMPSSMNQCTSWLRMNIDTYPTNTSTSARINGMERVCIYMRMPSLFIWLAEHPLNDGWQRMQWNGMNTKQVPKRNKREEKNMAIVYIECLLSLWFYTNRVMYTYRYNGGASMRNCKRHCYRLTDETHAACYKSAFFSAVLLNVRIFTLSQIEYDMYVQLNKFILVLFSSL